MIHHAFQNVFDLSDLIDILLSNLLGLIERGVLVKYFTQLRLLGLDRLERKVALAHIANQPVNLHLEIVPRRKRSENVKPALVAFE